MKKLLIIIALVAAYLPVDAQNIYMTRTGFISFFSKAPLEDIKAENNRVVSFLKLKEGELVFSVPIRSFEFEKKLMQEHFNEKYLFSDQYPEARFTGKILNLEEIDFQTPGKYKALVEGDLIIKGVTKKYKTEGEIEVQSGRIIANTVFPVRVADHEIEIPRLLVSNIAEVVDVTIRVEYLPFERP